MNCTIVQRRLLSLENPRRPPAELQAHLAGCAACRDWLRRLVEMERRVPLLPVPASTAKDAFLGRVLAGEVMPRRERPPARPSLPVRIDDGRRDRRLRKVALATALAAGLLMFFLGVALVRIPRQPTPSGPGPTSDPLLANLLTRDLKLAAPTTTPPDRFQTLADLADDLQGQAGPLADAKAGNDLQALAEWYRQVVHDGVETLGPTVSAPDREAVAIRLGNAGDSAEVRAKAAPEDCAPALWTIAIAARDASRSLRPGGRALQPPADARVPVRSLAGGLPTGPIPLTGCVPAVVLAAVVRAQSPAAPHSPDEQARRFHRNLGLIEHLVTGGLRLAGEDDPLKRADCCNGIAQGMADEIRQAAEDHEKGRVVELGQHLRSLLKDGVAENLRTARKHIPIGSAEEQKLQTRRTDTERFVKPLLEDIVDAADDIQKGLDSVENAVQAKP